MTRYTLRGAVRDRRGWLHGLLGVGGLAWLCVVASALAEWVS